MRDTEIIEFARANLEREECEYYGVSYRCAAYLTDGLYLPCVKIADSDALVNLAVRRFDETLADAKLPARKRKFGQGMQYNDVVRSFVTMRDSVAPHHIATIGKSSYAIPNARLREIHGETRMSWTQFVAVMNDGKEFAFGTTYYFDFFDMPEGYSGTDVARIISHGEGTPTYRERPFFNLYVTGLT